MCDIQMCENIRNTINPEGVVKKIVGTSLLLLKERRQKRKEKKKDLKPLTDFAIAVRKMMIFASFVLYKM